MLNPLRKRFKREMKTHADRYAAIFIIFAVMVLIISGFLVVAESVRITHESNLSENKVEDGQFTSAAEISEEVITGVEKLGTVVSENYYVDLELSTGQTVRIYENRTEINQPTLWEGSLPEHKAEIAIDRLFAQNHDLKVGDTITAGTASLRITGLISLPDYSSLFLENTDLMMDAYGFGVGIIPFETLGEFYIDEIIYNYSYRYNDRELDVQEKKELSDDCKEYLVEQQIPLTGFLMAQDNQSLSFFADDMGSDIPMMKTFLYIIQIIMAFVFTIIISSTVEEEAAIIGTLFATGYRKRELVRHYLVLPVLVTFAGAIVGNILTYTVGVKLFQNIYYGSYSLPPMQLRFNPEAFLLTTILPVILILIVNIILLCFKLSLSPLKFLRCDLKRTKQKRAMRLPAISFLQRFRLRVILQNKGNYIMLFFGMMFASFILLFGLCMQPLIRNYLNEIEAAAVSEYQYILKAAYEIGEEADAEAFSLQTLEIYYDKADKNLEVSFYGIEGDTGYWDWNVSDLGENEIIISEELGKKLGVKIGDMLTFMDAYAQETYELQVVGMKSYPAGFTAFMERAALNRMMEKEEGNISGYLSDEPLDIPEEYIANIVTPEDMARAGDQMLSTFGQMAYICMGAAIVIYLVVIYILTKIVVDKNTQNISFMKVMGYQDKEIKRLYLSATTIAVLGSLVVSLPIISMVLKKVFLLMFVRINGYLEPYLPMYLFGLVVCSGFVVYLAVNFIHMKRVRRIEMAEVLKNRE